MNIFYTTDTHFGHRNIIRFCNRPFNDIDEMDMAIIKGWNKKVGKYDIVYIIGDVSFRKEEETKNIIEQLNGKIVLIPGNHDKVMFRPEVSSLITIKNSIYKVYDNNRKVILCHFPIISWEEREHGSYHLYGHVHNSKKSYDEYFPKNQKNAYNAGMDVNDFLPQTLDELIERGNTYLLV